MKLRSCLLVVAFLSAALPAVVAPGIACAAEGPHAALVVDTGEEGDVYSMCVALPDEEVSGLDLIELAGEQYDLSYRFGYGGNAVCELAGVGSDGDDCFDRYPDFWGYWHGDASGGWTWAGSGAGSTRVEDGDVEGWSWGSGTNAESHPPPPAATFRSVCGYDPAPASSGGPRDGGSKPEPRETQGSGDESPGDEKDQREGGRENAQPPSDVEDSAATTTDDGREGRKRKKQWPDQSAPRKRSETKSERSPEPAPSADPSAATALPLSARSDEEGPPAAGIAALGLVAMMLGGALWFVRRRPKAD
jgi:hypothetical protein